MVVSSRCTRRHRQTFSTIVLFTERANFCALCQVFNFAQDAECNQHGLMLCTLAPRVPTSSLSALALEPGAIVNKPMGVCLLELLKFTSR